MGFLKKLSEENINGVWKIGILQKRSSEKEISKKKIGKIDLKKKQLKVD